MAQYGIVELTHDIYWLHCSSSEYLSICNSADIYYTIGQSDAQNSSDEALCLHLQYLKLKQCMMSLRLEAMAISPLD